MSALLRRACCWHTKDRGKSAVQLQLPAYFESKLKCVNLLSFFAMSVEWIKQAHDVLLRETGGDEFVVSTAPSKRFDFKRDVKRSMPLASTWYVDVAFLTIPAFPNDHK